MKSTTIIDLEFSCSEVRATNGYSRGVTVNIENVEKSDVLKHFTIQEIVDHFDDDKILDFIGEERVKHYFDWI